MGKMLQRSAFVLLVLLYGVFGSFIAASGIITVTPHRSEDSAANHLETKSTADENETDFQPNGISNRTSPSNARNNRSTRALVRENNPISPNSENEPAKDIIMQKIQPVTAKGVYIIPYLRPGRSSMMSDVEYSSSIENSEDYIDAPELVEKRDSMIPAKQFGRWLSKSHQKSSMIPSLRVGRSVELSTIDEDMSEEKKRDAMIPMIRVGRFPKVDSRKKWNFYKAKGRLDPAERLKNMDPSLILPYIRPGRSFSEIIEDMYEDYMKSINANLGDDDDESEEQTSENYMDDATSYAQDYLESIPTEISEDTFVNPSEDSENIINRRSSAENGTIIPYPRMGRSDSDFILDTMMEDKRQLIPQVRFGRNYNFKNKTLHPKLLDFVLPYPRPGRSEGQSARQFMKIKENPQSNPNNPYSILPYPRPGRAVNGNNPQQYLDPVSRTSRSLELYEDDFLIDNSQLVALYPMLSTWSQKYSPQEFREKLRKFGDKGSIFIIPYPRPGKRDSNLQSRSENRDNLLVLNDDLDDADSQVESDSEADNMATDSAFQNDGVVSLSEIPILKASGENNFQEAKVIMKRDTEYQTTNGYLANPKSNEASSTVSKDERLKSLKLNYVLPYPRPGRDSSTNDFMIPYARMGRSFNLIGKPHYHTNGHGSSATGNNFIVPYPRAGRSNSASKLYKINSKQTNKETYVVPYPRPGRSKTDTNTNSKYSSKELFVVPYPRPGRSKDSSKNSRLLAKISSKDKFVLPYPRPGRSSDWSLVPYPRPGRSGSIVPYPRPGRSGEFTIVPYPRPGRSGKSTIVPYPRPGRSGSVVPYPRPGRSGESTIVPYPRPGRSSEWSVVSYPRPGRSESNSTSESSSSTQQNTVIPYPRLGRSDGEQLRPNLLRLGNGKFHKLDKHMVREEDSRYLVPYPRPGRESMK